MIYELLFEKSRLKYDDIGGYRSASQTLKHIFSVIKAERFVWATIVQLFSFVRVDMIHHQENIILCQMIETGSLWKDPADKFMIDLNGSFFIRATRMITVEHICPMQ